MIKITATFASLFLLAFAQVASAQGSSVFLLNLEYNKGKFSTNDILVVPANWPGPVLAQSAYKYEVVSFNGDNLYSSRFVVPKEIIIEGRPPLVLDNVNFTIIAPYFSNAKEIKLLGGDNETLLSVKVREFPEETPKSTAFPLELVAVAIGVVAAGILVYFFIFSRRREAAQNPFRLS